MGTAVEGSALIDEGHMAEAAVAAAEYLGKGRNEIEGNNDFVSSAEDEVHIANYEQYSRFIAKMLAQDHDIIRHEILKFMEEAWLASDSGAVMESSFDPFEFRMAPQESSSDHLLARVVVNISVEKKDADMFLVRHYLKQEVCWDPAGVPMPCSSPRRSADACPANLEAAHLSHYSPRSAEGFQFRVRQGEHLVDGSLEDAARVVRLKLEELRQRTRQAVATLD